MTTIKKEFKKEKRLASLARKGNRKALKNLILKYVNFCYSIAITKLNDEKKAKRAVELTFEEIYNTIYQLYTPKGFRIWLYHILNRSIDEIKNNYSSYKDKSLDKKLDSYQTVDLEKLNKLKELIKNLSDEEKEILVLVDFEGLNSLEVSLLVEKDVKEIREILYRTKKKLINNISKIKYTDVEKKENNVVIEEINIVYDNNKEKNLEIEHKQSELINLEKE